MSVTQQPKTALPRVRIIPASDPNTPEIHVMAVPSGALCTPQTQSESVYREIVQSLKYANNFRIVSETVFGDLDCKNAVLDARRGVLKAAGLSAENPVNYIEGAPCDGKGLAGVNLTLVDAAAARVTPIRDDERLWGYAVDAQSGTSVYLSGVRATTTDHPPQDGPAQAEAMIRRTENLLAQAGLTYGSVVCTRSYLRRLLEWYPDFNGARNRCYTRLGLIAPNAPARLPASTGIQGKVSEDCECAMDVFAFSSDGGKTCPFVRLQNPLQNEAPSYGASFARAVSVDKGSLRCVIVSGTAAVDEKGHSIHLNDPVGQSKRTLENFRTILGVGGATPSDLVRAVIYCKHPSYAGIFRDEMRRMNWPDLPFIVVRADVCRDDLLVEIEGTALVNRAERIGLGTVEKDSVTSPGM